MTTSTRSTLVPMLVSAVAALAYVDYHIANYDVPTAPLAQRDVSAARQTTQDAKLPALASPPLFVTDYPQTTLRPIFFADRRMPEKPKPKPVLVADVKVQPALPPPDPLQLVGIMGSGPSKRALLRTKTDTQGKWLNVGDDYRGWQLREITTDNAIVEARGERKELRLYALGSVPSALRKNPGNKPNT